MSAGAALAYGVWKAVAYPPVAGYWITSFVISSELLFQYWLMSIGILFFGLMFFFGIPLQQRECWIILGFLTESLFVVSGFLLRSVFGRRFALASGALPAAAYLASKCIWLVGSMRKEESFYVVPNLGGISIEAMGTILDRQIGVVRQLLRRRPWHEKD